MQKPTELLKEIFISTGARGSNRSPPPSTKESKFTETKTKLLHPPIETHWQLGPPLKDRRRKSRLSFTRMLSQPFKYMQSFRTTQATQLVLEGPHNPNDQKLVDSFRELLFVEGYLSGKDSDYHTLLRYTSNPNKVDYLRFKLLIKFSLFLSVFGWLLCCRFLRMRDFDLVRAKDMFMQYIKWREEFRVDAIYKVIKLALFYMTK